MGNQQEISALVVGHAVRYLPKDVQNRRDHSTITHPAKIGASVIIMPDGSPRMQTLSSRVTRDGGVSVVLDKDEDPPIEMKLKVMDAVQEKYPFGARITVNSWDDDRGDKRYGLIERPQRK